MADSRKLLLKESYNNVFDTAEILWLLKGNESLSALDFVCKYIVNVSVVEREICVDFFNTFEDAQKSMSESFHKIDGVEELLKEEQASLDEYSAWCNAEGGDVSYDWEIFEIPQKGKV